MSWVHAGTDRRAAATARRAALTRGMLIIWFPKCTSLQIVGLRTDPFPRTGRFILAVSRIYVTEK
eukprot:scaffold310_cov335-Pavlova_lutheri.AAC.40